VARKLLAQARCSAAKCGSIAREALLPVRTERYGRVDRNDMGAVNPLIGFFIDEARIIFDIYHPVGVGIFGAISIAKLPTLSWRRG